MNASPLEDEEFEHSALSGPVSHGGETVEVEIYRRAGSQDPWRMEVVQMTDGCCTQWSVRFATDQEAYKAFQDVVAEHGLAIFADDGSDPRH